MLHKPGISKHIKALINALKAQPIERQIEWLNTVRKQLHQVSPFKHEPVDCVLWIKSESVEANDYNPNTVAPPEMKLLELSIASDGYTQPIVTWVDGERREVIDGFHRHRVGRESEAVRKRILGYLPVTTANESRTERGDRIAATIRHNRARGKHRVEAMSDIVIELKRRNWSEDKIGRELGMDPDEVLRLSQISGLAEAFANQDFSQAWDIEQPVESMASELLADDAVPPPSNGRIFHTWEKWECYRAGFYEEQPPNGMTQEQGEERYRAFLADLPRFEAALKSIITEWPHSCEHYLTNDRMNRIAWLGQAAVAQALRIPSMCRGGYHRLTEEQQHAADALALRYLNLWRAGRGEAPLTYDAALSRTEADLY